MSGAPVQGLGPDPALIVDFLKKAMAKTRLEVAYKVARGRGWTTIELSHLVQPSRRMRGLTYPQLGKLLGVSARQLQRYFCGGSEIPEKMVPRIAEVLGMQGGERRKFYILALRREPDPVAAAPDATRIPGSWLEFLHEQQPDDPAAIYDAAGTIIVANDAFWACFRWASPDGPTPEYALSRIFLSPQAQDCLENWETDWAVPVIRETWYSHLKFPGNPTLRALVADFSRDTRLRKLWEQRADCPVPWDGTVRRLRHPDPRLGLREAHFRCFPPDSVRALGYRCVVLRLRDPKPEVF